ncbi:hypothetical protein Leryth_006571 [Lithospermum erythrorhizon]|uniref:Dof zinc finger protein n=1 Tax=Lithospermum erythrorhizon TaxID=34254 RepID=A0AAV3Q0R1_LITER|nr:hypothetical protein Leryth_006571 [Lithospermum erythrorhizon]
MQDIHTLGGVGGGGGRIFTASGVDRRLQPHNHQNHQPLKCPRCDSQNTKFCYYNNYNLSQPRHFCKNCRRYWTKGGILRNVPVGGGCRKSKRSATKSKSSADTSATDSEKTELIGSNSHSSSESSSLTTTTISISGMAAKLDHYPPLIEQHQESLNGQMLPMMTNMVSSCNEPGLVGSNQELQKEKEKMMVCSTTEMVNMGFLDQHQEGHVDNLLALEQQSREKNSGLANLDWGNVGTGGDAHAIDKTGGDVGGGGAGGGGTEQGLFDFTGVDEAYWNQVQWVDDNEQSFNFLPQFQVLDFNLENK